MHTDNSFVDSRWGQGKVHIGNQNEWNDAIRDVKQLIPDTTVQL